MIYVNREDISEGSFVSLLEDTKSKLITGIGRNIPNGINGNQFEDLVFNQMVLSSANTAFDGHVEKTGIYSFPDIVVQRLYGAEVKMTTADKWTSTGNSVLESTRVTDVSTIYMFFGKFGNNFDIKYRKYQDCLNDIGVTHSPRYKIDMNLAEGQSIFSKMGIEYNDFRQDENSIRLVKRYYRNLLQEGQELWWIDGGNEERAVSPIIQTYSNLERNTRERFINECFVLFPEIVGSSQVKFERAAAYLVTNYNAVSSSLRDSFTAGGRVAFNYNGNGNEVTISRVSYKIFERAKEIRDLLYELPKNMLSSYWRQYANGDPVEMWLGLITEHYADEVNIKDIFLSGLEV
ncbi:MAG: hypothetical protein ABI402_03860 [Ferruginibacter sp.]